MKRSATVLGLVAVGCGTPATSSSPSPTSSASSPTATAASSISIAPSESAPAPVVGVPGKKPTTEDLFARLRSDFTGCYEEGRKAVPTMTSGKVTLHASVDKSGKTTCAVPSDDSGLTQDVEDCMRRRLGRESYPAQTAAWSAVIPIVVDNGALALGKPNTKPMIETIESHGLAEDMYDVVERILPDLKTCVRGMDKSSELRVVYVGAEVGKDGKVACALASSPAPVPDAVRECAASTLSKATFKPPKRGYGLISIPLEVLYKK